MLEQWGPALFALAALAAAARAIEGRKPLWSLLALVISAGATAFFKPALFALQQGAAETLYEDTATLFTNVMAASRTVAPPADWWQMITVAAAAGVFVLYALARRYLRLPALLRSRVAVLAIVAIAVVGLVPFAKAIVLPWQITGTAPQVAKLSGAAPQLAHGGFGLVVEIVDDASLLNFGFDGYFRETTPQLSKRLESDAGLLAFHRVLATHTQTTPALADLLSLGQSHIALFDALAQAGHKPRLVNTLNAPKLAPLFAAAAVENELPNLADAAPVFILRPLPINAAAPAVDDLLSTGHPRAVIGNAPVRLDAIEAYDAAIRQLDGEIASRIEMVEAQARPMIYVFTAAHGSSVYSGRGHDSFHVTHDMLRVPLLIYFNAAARTADPALFAKYQARRAQSASLAQFAPTVLDFLGAAPQQGPLLGDAFDAAAQAGLQPAPEALPDSPRHTDISSQEISTTYFNAEPPADSSRRICAHRNDTLARARRSTMLADCLELDIVAGPGPELEVYHPPAFDIGLKLERVVDYASRLHKAMWFDMKSIADAESCTSLLARIAARGSGAAPLLVEFPEQAYEEPELVACGKRIRDAGLPLSYYLTTKMIRRCSDALDGTTAFEASTACRELEDDVKAARAAIDFTDISFDYRGFPAVKAMPSAAAFRWNTWYITPAELAADTTSPFHFVIFGKDGLNYN